MNNPFLTQCYGGRMMGAVSVEDRVRALRDFTLEQCRQALELQDLQKSVMTALERRIRKLEKEAGA